LDTIFIGTVYRNFTFGEEATVDMIPWKFEDVNEPWTLFFTREKANDESVINFSVFSKTKFEFSQFPQPTPNYHQFSFTVKLNPGVTDGLEPYSTSIALLDQWTVSAEKPTLVIIYLRQTLDEESQPKLFFEKNGGTRIRSFYRTQKHLDYQSKPQRINEFRFNFDDVSEPWTFALSRVASPKVSEVALQFYSLEPIKIEAIPNPPYSQLFCTIIRGTLSPGFMDDRTPFGLANQASIVPQYLVTVNSK
jgi:hypothetical protein